MSSSVTGSSQPAAREDAVYEVFHGDRIVLPVRGVPAGGDVVRQVARTEDVGYVVGGQLSAPATGAVHTTRGQGERIP